MFFFVVGLGFNDGVIKPFSSSFHLEAHPFLIYPLIIGPERNTCPDTRVEMELQLPKLQNHLSQQTMSF